MIESLLAIIDSVYQRLADFSCTMCLSRTTSIRHKCKCLRKEEPCRPSTPHAAPLPPSTKSLRELKLEPDTKAILPYRLAHLRIGLMVLSCSLTCSSIICAVLVGLREVFYAQRQTCMAVTSIYMICRYHLHFQKALCKSPSKGLPREIHRLRVASAGQCKKASLVALSATTSRHESS